MKGQIAELIVAAARSLGAEVERDVVQGALAEPPNRELGDIAFPCFVLARSLRRPPAVIATDLAEAMRAQLADEPQISGVAAVGPYINIRLDPDELASRVLAAAAEPGYGTQRIGAGKTIGIDFSSPNIAKPFGIGHLRSTAIGGALRNIFTQLGYRVVGINHLGDWGTQFGKLIAAFERWGDEDALEGDPIKHLYDLYVRFHKEAERDKRLDEEGRAWFKRLEEGDDEAQRYWSRFRALSLEAFEEIYERLGVSFDHYWGEAFYESHLEGLVKRIADAGLLEESEGARVVRLDEHDLPPCLILKSDGATLYATRDLAAAVHRYRELKFDQFLYVVGAAQAIHFRQVIAVLDEMDLPWADRMHHVPFGMILGISTRKGTLVFLEEILDAGKELALEQMADREGLTDEERDEIADQIAVGAVIFSDLYRNRIKDYQFDWDAMLDLQGRTGPYLQYTHVRLLSLEENYRDTHGALPSPDDVDYSLLREPEAQAIIAVIDKYPRVLRAAARDYEPAVVSRYLIELAETFNSFYSGGFKVVSDDSALSDARIALVRGVRHTLAAGLRAIGVPMPTRM